MSRRFAVILVGLAMSMACSEDNNRSNQVTTFDRDQDNNANNAAPDDGNNTPTGDMGMDAETPDMAVEMDFAVAAEGPMHGTWLASRNPGADIATLRIRHEVGETSLSGTFQMNEPAAFGQLGGTTWLEDTFTTSWTTIIDGLDERFSLTMCTAEVSNEELACRFADPLTGDVVDATLTKQ